MNRDLSSIVMNLLLAGSIVAGVVTFGCTGSEFAGSGTRGNAPKADDPDSGDTDTPDASDVPDTGDTDTPDADDIPDNGDTDSEGDVDTEDDDTDDEGDEDDDIDDGDDETSMSTRHDMTLKRTNEDFDDLKIKIELLDDDGDTEKSFTVEVPEEGGDTTVAKACRTGRVTKLALTFMGSTTLMPGDKCVFLVDSSDTSITIDADTEPFLDSISGGCKPGEDDRIVLECPKSKGIEVDGL